MKNIIKIIAILLIISGCSILKQGEANFPKSDQDEREEKHGKLGGEGGFKLFGSSEDDSGKSGIDVNSFLWRASLDTISFMPIASADPHGGTIITDWYENPQSRGERFKINILILGKTLRSDGVKLSVFKQIKTKRGEWQDAAVNPSLARELEDKILTRARELRIKTINNG